MINKIAVIRRWRGKIPVDKAGVPIPKSLWPQRRKCCYVVRWFAINADGRRVRPSRRFPTKAEAEAYRDELAHKFMTKPDARRIPKQVTVAQFVDEFVRLRIGPRGTRLRARSIESAKVVLNRLAAAIGGDRLLSDVRPEDAARYFAGLHTTGLSVSSINVHKRTAKAAIQCAVDQLGYLQQNPLARIRADKVTDRVPRFVTHTEFAAILGACDAMKDELWWRALVTICYTAALRLGEALNLLWTDIDVENRTVRVCAKDGTAGTLEWSPKDSELRLLPIPAETVGLIQKLREESTDGHPYVFITATRLQVIRAAQTAGKWREAQAISNNVARGFRRVVSIAAKTAATLLDADKKPTVSLHDLRRTCLTTWSRCVSIQDVMRLAGHSSVTTTQKYYLATTEDQFRLAREAASAALAASRAS